MKKTKKVNYFIHPQAICESLNIGAGTKIWAFSHILSGAKIGSEANICEHVFVENNVVIGNRGTIKSHVSLWDSLRIEDDVFIGPGVVFANDKYPRSKRYLSSQPITYIRKGASIGGSAVILPGMEVGNYAMVAAGTVVSKDVKPFDLVLGNPGRRVGKVCRCGGPLKKTLKGWRCSWGDWKGLKPSLRMRCSKC